MAVNHSGDNHSTGSLAENLLVGGLDRESELRDVIASIADDLAYRSSTTSSRAHGRVAS
jgi:hypothetical protein